MTTLLEIEPLRQNERQVLREMGYSILSTQALSAEAQSKIDVLYGWEDQIGREILARADHQLRWVQNIGAGINNLPAGLLLENGIQVTNASGDKAIPIAQSVLASLFYVARGINYYEQQKKWQPKTDLYLLSEFPVMIFGTGQIAQQLAAYLNNFDAKVIGVNTTGHPADHFARTISLAQSKKSLSKVKAVVSTLPGTTATQHFFDDAFFNETNLALFVNVGRGMTVNEEALISALQTGRLNQAVLDVTENEPISKESPLWSCPNLTLTQHSSWAEESYPQRGGRIFEIIRQNFLDFIEGKPLSVNRVDLKRGY